jgi:hypothetical protein
MRYIFGEDAACYAVFICTNVSNLDNVIRLLKKIGNRLPVIVIAVPYSELRVE